MKNKIRFNLHFKNRISQMFSWAAIVGLSLAMSACQNNYDIDDRQLTVSIEPLRFITESIVGDCYSVKTLTPEGVSPETYMPTPQQIANINKGSAYIYLGSLGFEQQRLNKIIENCPHLYSINVSENIALLQHESHEGCCIAASDSGDPHIWTSPRNMKTIAQNIHQALCRMDSANVGTYNLGLQRFNQHMDSIDVLLHQELDSIPNRVFLINHPALAYFAVQYNLKQLSIEKDGKEASAERMAMLIDECKAQKVKTVFIQKQNNGRTATHIAKEIGADTLIINPLSYSWDKEMLHIAKTLAK